LSDVVTGDQLSRRHINEVIMMRILRKPEVEHRVGLSGMEIWRREKAGSFPRKVRLGPNSVGWVEAEIDAYLEELVAARDARRSSDD